MTRERAAEICQYIKFILKNEDYTEEVEEALNIAIKALEQEPCDDCIWFRQGVQRTRRGYAYERKTEE